MTGQHLKSFFQIASCGLRTYECVSEVNKSSGSGLALVFNESGPQIINLEWIQIASPSLSGHNQIESSTPEPDWIFDFRLHRHSKLPGSRSSRMNLEHKRISLHLATYRLPLCSKMHCFCSPKRFIEIPEPLSKWTTGRNPKDLQLKISRLPLWTGIKTILLKSQTEDSNWRSGLMTLEWSRDHESDWIFDPRLHHS